MNDDEIDEELRCHICNDPFQYPVNCIRCGQTYCQNCIDRWYQQQTSCPFCRQNGYLFVPVITRILLNQLDRLLVQCSQCQQMNIQRNHFIKHLSFDCPKEIVNCTNVCPWEGCREDLQEHLITCGKNRFWFFQRFSCRCF